MAFELVTMADFVALAEHGSFSRAASARNVTQPAFSRRIQSLEQSMGMVLVDRSTTPITLTTAGKRFLDHARRIVALSQTAASDMRHLATNMPDAVHVLTSNSLASSFFPSWYKKMQRHVKGLQFRVNFQRSARSLDDLRHRLADFVIQASIHGHQRPLSYDGIVRQVIGSDRLHLVKAASLGKESNTLIVYKPDSHLNPSLFKMLGKQRLSRMTVSFESPNSELARSMALAGYGVALLQEGLIADDLRDGYLIPAFDTIKPLKTDISLLRADHPLSDHAEALWASAAKA